MKIDFDAKEKLDTALMMQMGAACYLDSLTEKECGNRFGVSDILSRKAKAYYRGYVEGRADAEAETGPDGLPKPASKKADAYKAKLERDFVWRVERRAAEIYADQMEEFGMPALRKLADKVERRRGHFTREQFMTILAALHPDNSASPEKRAEAFRLINDAKELLMDNRQHPVRTGAMALPTTREDLLKRRTEMAMARRKAKA